MDQYIKKLELKFVLSDQKNWDVGSINGIIFPGIGNFNKVAENIKRFNLDKKILFLVKKYTLSRYMCWDANTI